VTWVFLSDLACAFFFFPFVSVYVENLTFLPMLIYIYSLVCVMQNQMMQRRIKPVTIRAETV